MKAHWLALAVPFVVAGGAYGAYGRGWLELDREKHPAVEAFEVFYWKLQKHDLAAAGELVLPGSDAERTLAVERDAPTAPDAAIARGFALQLSHEADGELAGRPVIRLSGQATVTVDPAGYVSAFGEPVPHEVEARLVEDGGSWRVAAFRDTVLTR